MQRGQCPTKKLVLKVTYILAVAFYNMVEAQTSSRLDMGLDNELGMLLNSAYLQTKKIKRIVHNL